MASELDSWDEATPVIEVSTQELDALVQRMDTLWDESEKVKKLASEARAAYDEVEARVLAMLKAAGKKSYIVDGLGTVSITNKYMITTPKGIEEKKRLFAYINKEHGEEGLYGLLTINSQTLNSFVNAELDRKPEVQIPGLDAPTHRESLSFRAKKK